MEGRTNKIEIKDVKGTYLAKLSLHECLFESVYQDFWRSYYGSMCVSDRGVIPINKKRVAGTHSRCQITVTTNYSPLIVHGPIFTVEFSTELHSKLFEPSSRSECECEFKFEGSVF